MMDAMIVAIPKEDEGRFEGEKVEIEIEPSGWYDALQTAILLGITGSLGTRRNAVYKIPTDQLPRTARGAGGGKYGYRGQDIIDYIRARTDNGE